MIDEGRICLWSNCINDYAIDGSTMHQKKTSFTARTIVIDGGRICLWSNWINDHDTIEGTSTMHRTKMSFHSSHLILVSCVLYHSSAQLIILYLFPLFHPWCSECREYQQDYTSATIRHQLDYHSTWFGTLLPRYSWWELTYRNENLPGIMGTNPIRSSIHPVLSHLEVVQK